jgi:hypothetical protein
MDQMSKDSAFFMCEQSCDAAVAWMVEQIRQAGMKVIPTFDLQIARHAQVACPCPHHGTEQCDCQMVVLLVYWEDRTPITIIAHGHNHQTRFVIVDNPQQHADPTIGSFIRQAVTFPSKRVNDQEAQVPII